jgi:HK97 family phage major capsid protein
MCKNCVFFDGGGMCDIVAGNIEPEAVCKLWIIPGELVTASEPIAGSTAITFTGIITAADVESRTVRGLVVPFGKVGNTSAGPVQFSQSAFGDIAPENVILNLEHDRTRPIGRGIEGSAQVSPAGVSMAFKIANTTAGTDALIEAADGLRSSFSIEAMPDDYTIKGGVMHVSKSTIVGVAQVTNPAFKDAQITHVAASEPEAPEADTAAEETPTQEETMAENAVEAADSAPAVVQATVGHAQVAPRSPIKTQADYLMHKVRASHLQDADSATWVAHADAEAIKAANDSFTTNPAFSPVQYVPTVIDTSIGTRPAIDAIGVSALQATGMTVSYPKITTSGTVAVTAEAGAPSNTGIVSAYTNLTVKKYAGRQIYSLEVLERSGPDFYAAMLNNMQRAYAKATDAAVIAELTASGTQAATTAATSAGIISFVSTEAAAAYLATGEVPTTYIAGTGQWSLLMGAVDSTGRPIYNAINPANAAGASSPRSLRGSVLGLDLWIDPNVVSTVIDESAFIVSPGSVAILESPQVNLSTNVIGSGEIDMSLNGFMAVGVLVAGGVRRFNLT